MGGEGLSLLRWYGLVVVIDGAGLIAINLLIVPIVANASRSDGDGSGSLEAVGVGGRRGSVPVTEVWSGCSD